MVVVEVSFSKKGGGGGKREKKKGEVFFFFFQREERKVETTAFAVVSLLSKKRKKNEHPHCSSFFKRKRGRERRERKGVPFSRSLSFFLFSFFSREESPFFLFACLSSKEGAPVSSPLHESCASIEKSRASIYFANSKKKRRNDASGGDARPASSAAPGPGLGRDGRGSDRGRTPGADGGHDGAVDALQDADYFR